MQFENDILEARRPKLTAERAGGDELREMKWKDVGKGEFEAYRRVIDAYFDFAGKRMKSSEGTIEFHCSVVLTQVRGRAFSGGRGKKGFNNEVFQHCLKVAVYHKTKLFHIYLVRVEGLHAPNCGSFLGRHCASVNCTAFCAAQSRVR